MNDDTAPDHLDISLDQLLNIRAPGTYFVKVEGDSMEGAGIFCRDLLIVRKEAALGQIKVPRSLHNGRQRARGPKVDGDLIQAIICRDS